MKTQNPYYITTEKISVGYDGKPLIEEVEIALRKGEILTLLGPNGAGKSTILKSIARQLSLIAGTVRLDGEDMKSLTGAELSKKMAVVMTKRLRGELMTCEDVVATGRYPYTGRFGVLRAEDHAAVQNAMKLVQVAEIGDSLFDRISDGQRQRVMLARAICQEPEILILDEPTSALTEKETEVLMQIIRTLKGQGVSIVYISHRLEEVFQICDSATIMRDGQYITTLDVAGTTKDELVRYMVGRDVVYQYGAGTSKHGKELLRVEHLTSGNAVKDVSFCVHEGEVLGLAGLEGAGRTELMVPQKVLRALVSIFFLLMSVGG